MNNNRMSKIMLNCRPNGRNRLGRTLERLLDVAGTGPSRANWWRIIMMVIYKVSCLRTGHTVNVYHIKVKVVPHVPRRHILELELYLDRSATRDLVSNPPICAREMEKVPVLQRTGLAVGVSLEWSGKPLTTEVQTRTVQPVASR